MAFMAEDVSSSEAPLPEVVTSEPSWGGAVGDVELDQEALLSKLDEQNRLVEKKTS